MTTSILDVRKDETPFSLRDAMRHARTTTGKSLPAQAREILQLRRLPGGVGMREYYYYRLYDDRRYTPAEKRRFLARRVQQRVAAQCTDRRWWALANDKPTFHALMQGHGLPVPPIVATYHPYRRIAAAEALHTPAELAAFLRTRARYPMFSKPFDGIFSLGTARVDGYDAAADAVISSRGERVPVDTFIESVQRYARRGYLFQEVLRPHPRVRALCGDRVATVRMVVLLGDQGPELFRTLWKIPAGPHVGDNFWRRGNILAGLDRDSGRVLRALTGAGHEQRTVERHPDTGQPLEGLVVPDWDRLRALCLAAAGTLPGIRMQAWDIAPCEEGPVLVEVNIIGDFNLPQLAGDAGLLDEQLRSFLARWKFR